MWFYFFSGKRKGLAGSFDVFLYECPYCHDLNSTTLFVYSCYVHFLWIPVFPYMKEGASYCSSCGTRKKDSSFGPKLVAEYRAHENKIHHRWWTWAWPLAIITIVLLAIISATL